MEELGGNYYENLSEKEVFERIKEELKPIQESLSEKKITIDEVKTELKRIGERIQETKLEKKDKKEIWKAIESLLISEKNIDENTLNEKVEDIIKIIKTLTKKDLAKLKKNIQQDSQRSVERPIEVQQWIDIASNNLEMTIHEASHDQNPIARKIGERMENLMA